VTTTLKPEPLTAESFRPYGDVIETAGSTSISINSGNCQRYTDLASLDIDGSGVTGISIFDAKPYGNPIQLNYVERHPLGTQAFIPMSNQPYLVIVADDVNGMASEPRVFITNGAQGVSYGRNVWHGVLTPIIEQSLFTVVDYIGDLDNLEEYAFETPYLIEFISG